MDDLTTLYVFLFGVAANTIFGIVLVIVNRRKLAEFAKERRRLNQFPFSLN